MRFSVLAGLFVTLAAITTARAQPVSPPQPAPPQPAPPGTSAVSLATLQITDGDSLVARCSPSQSDPQRGLQQLACAAYIAGATDAISGINKAGAGAKLFCVPAEASYGKVRDAAINMVKDNPSMGKTNAGLIVALAIPGLYPCPK